MQKHERQILAIKNKIKKGKVKNPDKAKAKIRDIQVRQNWSRFLAQ